MKSIKLSNGKSAMVSDDDFTRVSKYSWYTVAEGDTTIAKRSIQRADGTRTTQSMHRFVSGVKNSRTLVSHIDGNGLNNVRENLVKLTASSIQLTRSKQPGCATRFKGVTKDGDRYRARITHNGKNISLGNFKSQKEAALAYNARAVKLYGDIASLNKV